MSYPAFDSTLADLRHQYVLLQKEFEQEKEAYRMQCGKDGIAKHIRQGLCWYPVHLGRSRYNALNQFVLEVERQDEKEEDGSERLCAPALRSTPRQSPSKLDSALGLSERLCAPALRSTPRQSPSKLDSALGLSERFEYGRSVCFFHIQAGGEIRFLEFPATVNYVDGKRMGIVLPSPAVLSFLQGRDIGIQLYFDETSYKTMFQALSEVMKAKGDRLAELREILIGKSTAAWRETVPVHLPWLNASQEKAVNQVLASKDVAIVHGPPGTGKTTTLVEAIHETLRRENQVLVCAQSNTAVDWISEQLVDRGLHVLRIGNPTRVNDKMLSFTYERRFESHPDYPELWSIRRNIRELQTRLRKMSREEKDKVRNRLSKLRSRATELEIKINTELFNEAHVIASTLVGAAHRVLYRRNFNSLFIDEASQALEAACWIAIAKAKRVILAGDHQQLPPTIKDPDAAREGLEYTLMQKISERKPETVSLLRIQYRMNELIMKFPSRWFYHGMLQAAPEVKHRCIVENDTPLVWLDTSGTGYGEDMNPGNPSRVNPEEALLAVNALQDYILQIGPERVLEEKVDFGLISPYQAQVQYLRALVRQKPFFKAFRPLLSIHTVDGFQGQERDVILISLVRANEQGRIGFLRDLRRMNVAMTRARMKLIIVGDAGTLSRHPFYARLLRYIQENGQVRSLLPPESKDTTPALPDAKSSENQP